jgi:ER-bound oxygenase mpaB/B'/Rubber oxygenase, catalytic domain
MPRPTNLDLIRALDPEKDHQRIVFLITCYEFAFDMTRSLELALFRTFCVPSISAVLDGTGEFRDRAQKRYDDTDLIVSELVERGYDSERGRRALRRMNQQHGRFAIANEDFLYVLSAFIYEPIRWNSRFGWRPMCEEERLGLFFFWREVGRRMGIKELPAGYAEFERYNIEYEKRHYRYTEANHRVATATLDMFASWFPPIVRPLVRRSICALLEDPVLQGFGFRRPSPMLRRLVRGVLRLRAKALRWVPARRRPRLRTEMKHRSYPAGYRIEELGPPVGPKAGDQAAIR